MSYHANRSLASLVDLDLIDEASDRMVERTGDAMLENMKERTPVAKPVVVADDKRKPRERRPGTARESWRETAVEHRGDVRSVSAESEDKVVDWLDKGTPPHAIRRKSAGALAFPQDGEIMLRGSVQHPGTEPLAIVDRGLAATDEDFARIGREETERWAAEQGAR